jgi:hypothetical protein
LFVRFDVRNTGENGKNGGSRNGIPIGLVRLRRDKLDLPSPRQIDRYVERDIYVCRQVERGKGRGRGWRRRIRKHIWIKGGGGGAENEIQRTVSER